MLNFINKHKGLSIIFGLAIILFIILLVIFISLFTGGSKSKFGNRLDGIEEVKLSGKFLNEIENELEENENVVDANVGIVGKRLSIQFEISSGDLKDTAKEIANATLSKFSEDELEFYELGYIINWTIETDEGKVVNAIQGTKHPLKDGITWSNN